MGDLTFIAVVIVAVLVAWGAFEWHLKCREVDQLRQELDEWQGQRGWQPPFGYRSSEWDTMCVEMKADVTGTATAAGYVLRDDDE